MKIEYLTKLKLPDNPGVYFWKKGPDILYIGRATSLRDRVKSYFGNDIVKTRGPRIVDMVTKSDRVKWEATDSVLEAIILEANLIKKHQPHYNVDEKDDKSFNYVCITKDEFPKVIIVRGKDLNTKRTNINTTFGPFTSGSLLREALRIVRKMFPFMDERSSSKYGQAFYRQLGLTPGTATLESREEYLENIKNIKLFFEGKKALIVSTLRKQMMECAKKREFEKAGEIKKKIFALEHIKDVSLIKEESYFSSNIKKVVSNLRLEAYDVAHTSGKESVGVMTVLENGELKKSDYRKFKLLPDIGNDDVRSLSEIINRRFLHKEWTFPDVAVIDGGIGQRNRATALIKSLSPNTAVVAVVKNEQHRPKAIIGPENISKPLRKEILLVNSEAHRFAINFHRKRMRNR